MLDYQEPHHKKEQPAAEKHVDPAGMGADRTSIAWRQGRCITKVKSRRGLDTMETCGWIQKIIRDEKPERVNIDVGGMGVGIYDRLVELGHSRDLVQAVNFGGKAGRAASARRDREARRWSR